MRLLECAVDMHQKRCNNRSAMSFACLDQYLSMAFAQFTYRESLRDIVACLRAQVPSFYHLDLCLSVTHGCIACTRPAVSL